VLVTCRHANVTIMTKMVRAVAILLYYYYTTDITGRTIAQAASRQLPTATARVPSHVRLFGICGGQCGTGALLRSPLSIRLPPTGLHSLTILSSRY
jgi:hypothetical protein